MQFTMQVFLKKILLKTCYMPDTILGTGAKNLNKIEFDILCMSACNSEDRYLNKFNTTW